MNEADFQGICPRLCTQDSEWEAYNKIRSSEFKKLGKMDISVSIQEEQRPGTKHLVLYQGTKIVAAAQLEGLGMPYTNIMFLGSLDKENEEYYRLSLLKFIEKWVSKNKGNFLTIHTYAADVDFFKSQSFQEIGKPQNNIDLIKKIDQISG